MARTILLAVVLAAVATPQRTWTVGPGAASFTTIPAAVQAAAAGDLILVQPGSYALDFTMSKGVAIVGDPSQPPEVYGRLTISGLPAGSRAALRGLVAKSFEPPAPARSPRYLPSGSLSRSAPLRLGPS